MGTRERRVREREGKRDIILQVARDILAESGPHALSLREVARRAEYSPASLYEYFRDREAILLALFSEGFQRFGDALNNVPTDQPTPARLRGLALAYIDFAAANPQHYELMFAQPYPTFEPDAEADTHAWATFQILVQCIADGVADGSFRPLDDTGVLVMALTQWSALHGFVSLQHAGRMGDASHYPAMFLANLDRMVAPTSRSEVLDADFQDFQDKT
jgi:AcrR family transcriptional regulator